MLQALPWVALRPIRERHKARGKLLPRERVERLLDPGSPFLEIAPACGVGACTTTKRPAAGVIAGIGRVSRPRGDGRRQRFDRERRRLFPVDRQKTFACPKNRARGKPSAMSSIWSIRAGANLPFQADVFPDQEHFGRIFLQSGANVGSKGIAQIASVMGSCTAGGAYVPAMSDETVIVRGQGTIFLAGPPLVKAATGEVISAEELGGADTHGTPLRRGRPCRRERRACACCWCATSSAG